MKVEYFTIDGAQGEYFTCSPYRASVSVDGCARMYRAEKEKPGRHMHCFGCPIGAHHAGERPIASPSVYKSLVCPRCHRVSHRLVRGLCVSCLNRQYELIRGLNAKGKPPVRLRPLARREVTIFEDGCAKVAVADLAASQSEVFLRVLRSRADVVGIGWRSRSYAPGLRVSDALFAPEAIKV